MSAARAFLRPALRGVGLLALLGTVALGGAASWVYPGLLAHSDHPSTGERWVVLGVYCALVLLPLPAILALRRWGWRPLRAPLLALAGAYSLVAAPALWRAGIVAGEIPGMVPHGFSAEQIERGRAMVRRSPEAAARRAVLRGDLRLVGVDGFVAEVPGVESFRVWMHHGARMVPGTGDVLVDDEHVRHQGEAYCFALRYNRELVRLGEVRGRISPKDRAAMERDAAECRATGARSLRGTSSILDPEPP